MRYLDITKADVANGPGVRVTLWVAGCNHCCPGCHNIWTWDRNQGPEFDQYAQNLIIEMLNKPYIKGLTLTGGDPVYAYDEEFLYFLKFIKRLYPQKNIWMWTGYVYEHIHEDPILDYVDVLVDGPYLAQERDLMLPWRGSRNQRIIDIKKTKETGKIVELQI